MLCHCKVACTNSTISLMFGCKKYRIQDEDGSNPQQDQGQSQACPQHPYPGLEGRERELPGSHHGTLRSHHGTLDGHHQSRGEREGREGRGEGRPELVQVSEKNLSRIEYVHGYVSHAHISPMKVESLECVFDAGSPVGYEEVPVPDFSTLYATNHALLQVTPTDQPPAMPHSRVIPHGGMLALVWYAKKMGRCLIKTMRRTKGLQRTLLVEMNFIFGNNTQFPRGGRSGGGGGQGHGGPRKQKQGPKRCSSEELHSGHNTGSPSSSSFSSSRWQQLITFISKRNAFITLKLPCGFLLKPTIWSGRRTPKVNPLIL
ncbi:hypothetical protein J4Q44_G00201620 [Coregonus suidteri]|uniref:Disks large homologue 1 N-terminal PEST domain-containing protein n=1 Tax=Coregonus suidteri TaxID=861788 RepID=A0AAN8LFM2_9TELE